MPQCLPRGSPHARTAGDASLKHLEMARSTAGQIGRSHRADAMRLRTACLPITSLGKAASPGLNSVSPGSCPPAVLAHHHHTATPPLKPRLSLHPRPPSLHSYSVFPSPLLTLALTPPWTHATVISGRPLVSSPFVFYLFHTPGSLVLSPVLSLAASHITHMRAPPNGPITFLFHDPLSSLSLPLLITLEQRPDAPLQLQVSLPLRLLLFYSLPLS